MLHLLEVESELLQAGRSRRTVVHFELGGAVNLCLAVPRLLRQTLGLDDAGGFLGALQAFARALEDRQSHRIEPPLGGDLVEQFLRTAPQDEID
jgi:hypothetical protein